MKNGKWNEDQMNKNWKICYKWCFFNTSPEQVSRRQWCYGQSSAGGPGLIPTAILLNPFVFTVNRIEKRSKMFCTERDLNPPLQELCSAGLGSTTVLQPLLFDSHHWNTKFIWFSYSWVYDGRKLSQARQLASSSVPWVLKEINPSRTICGQIRCQLVCQLDLFTVPQCHEIWATKIPLTDGFQRTWLDKLNLNS